MATKPYPPIEETPSVASEPAVAYQRTDPSTYHGTAPFEPDNELRPFTMAELNRWMDEVEAEDDAEAVPHEEVMQKMRELVLAYEK